ncbi:MAG: DUF72 domain-containing protein, partial [Bryobacteraceae bacterium]|nr:DUF72 domain-containing protein [Bryobacteraceae bacterium]
CESFLEIFIRAIDPLRIVGRLGPVLFQLPPTLKFDPELLKSFNALLPDDVRFAFEFRHSSWLDAPIYDILTSRGICLCLAESDKLVVPHVFTAPFVYFRLRKPDYSPEETAEISMRVSALAAEGKDVYLYFKHEDSPEGALNAELVLRQLQSHES